MCKEENGLGNNRQRPEPEYSKDPEWVQGLHICRHLSFMDRKGFLSTTHHSASKA